MAETTKQLKQIVEHLSYTMIIKNTPIELEEIKLQSVIDKCLSTLQMQIIEIHPILSIELEVSQIKTKSAYIESVFLNLLSNALKYRSPNRLLQINIKSEPYINGRTLITFSDIRPTPFPLRQRFIIPPTRWPRTPNGGPGSRSRLRVTASIRRCRGPDIIMPAVLRWRRRTLQVWLR